MTQIQAASSNSAGLQQPDTFRLTFGRHKNTTLLEIEEQDPALIAWMLGEKVEDKDYKNVGDEQDEKDEKDEKRRQDEALAVHEEYRVRSFRREWKPPELASAPAKFRDQFWRDKWITKFDAGKFFHVEQGLLSKLQTASLKDRFEECGVNNPSNPKYWLYHVWALVKAHESEADADEALRMFEDESRRQRKAEEMALWAR